MMHMCGEMSVLPPIEMSGDRGRNWDYPLTSSSNSIGVKLGHQAKRRGHMVVASSRHTLQWMAVVQQRLQRMVVAQRRVNDRLGCLGAISGRLVWYRWSVEAVGQ